MSFLVHWAIVAAALWVAAYLVPGVTVRSTTALLIAALVLGLVNAFIRPLLILLTLPVTVLTLGIFILVLNGLLFWFVGSFVEGFVVPGFWAGFFGAILFSIVSWVLSALVLKGGRYKGYRARG